MEQDHPIHSQQSDMIDQKQEEELSSIAHQHPQEKLEASEKSSQSTIQVNKETPNPLQTKMMRYKAASQGSDAQVNKLNSYMCDMKLYFGQKTFKNQLNQSSFNIHSVIDPKDADRIRFSKIFSDMNDQQVYSPAKLNLSLRQSRGIASVLGMGIGDALGSCTQFKNFNKKGLGIVFKGFSDLQKFFARSGKFSVWTDDASMGLCMADSILLNDYIFNPTHMRYLFELWLSHGLNNGGRPHSIGLGGNISISMYEFASNQKQNEYTKIGDRFNNGNGSLMRLAPVPVAYSYNLQKGIEYSGKQSLTTHNGLEAEECAKLMGKIIIQLINRDQNKDGKELIIKVCDQFQSPAKSVQFLAKGQQQSEQLYAKSCNKYPKFKTFNKTIKDRKWNWREQDYTYAPTRLSQQPGYIGSYCMDALSMALHTVIFSKSFAEVVIKNADMGGDCDTVGSIAGQIAGALYGIDERMLELYSEMEDFKYQRYQVFLKGYKLINRKTI